ncbi:MAG: hypothetical protein ACREHC_03735 [Candidatus Levyibacteriota bacterium]
MTDSYKTILLKILDAIEYTDDKEAFANEFMQNTSLQTVTDLVDTLPHEKKEEVKKAFVESTTDETVSEILKKYFSEEQKQKAFENAVSTSIKRWMQAIQHTLNESQKKNLADLEESITSGISHSQTEINNS